MQLEQLNNKLKKEIISIENNVRQLEAKKKLMDEKMARIKK